MILTPLSFAYGTAATWRRRWYARHPRRRRTLARPVISIGNLTVGGSGKTPLVEYVARLLLAAGERPAILTRGYKRQSARAGVTVVSDRSRVIASLAESGDEPLMLARALPGVAVLVGADRYASGQLAERTLGATVHLLDDGFQHVRLSRTVDLLVVHGRDLDDRVLPAGRLREPAANATAADALLVTDDDDKVARTLGVETIFHVRRSIGEPLPLEAAVAFGREIPVLAVAGIARPERFFNDLSAAGWRLARTIAFPDHHQFTRDDIDRLRAAAADAKTSAVLTTTKDAVRLEVVDRSGLNVFAVPLTVQVSPAESFRSWLLDRTRQGR